MRRRHTPVPFWKCWSIRIFPSHRKITESFESIFQTEWRSRQSQLLRCRIGMRKTCVLPAPSGTDGFKRIERRSCKYQASSPRAERITSFLTLSIPSFCSSKLAHPNLSIGATVSSAARLQASLLPRRPTGRNDGSGDVSLQRVTCPEIAKRANFRFAGHSGTIEFRSPAPSLSWPRTASFITGQKISVNGSNMLE